MLIMMVVIHTYDDGDEWWWMMMKQWWGCLIVTSSNQWAGICQISLLHSGLEYLPACCAVVSLTSEQAIHESLVSTNWTSSRVSFWTCTSAILYVSWEQHKAKMQGEEIQTWIAISGNEHCISFRKSCSELPTHLHFRPFQPVDIEVLDEESREVP